MPPFPSRLLVWRFAAGSPNGTLAMVIDAQSSTDVDMPDGDTGPLQPLYQREQFLQHIDVRFDRGNL